MVRKGTGGSPSGLQVVTGPKVGPPAPHLPAPCRAADGLDACPVLPKQARPENGEYSPSTTGHSSAFQLSTDPSGSPPSLGSRLLGSKEAPRAAGPVSPEEGAERTKHSKRRAGGQRLGWGSHPLAQASRWLFDQNLGLCLLCPESGRKQKTPKKFTGEQPSISGTFGLKGRALASWASGVDAHTRVTAPLAHSCPPLCVCAQA